MIEEATKGAVEGFLDGTFRNVGKVVSKRRRRSIVLRITELIGEPRYYELEPAERLLWIFYQLKEDDQVGQAAERLMSDPKVIPALIKQQARALEELRVEGIRLSRLDVRAVMPAA